MYKKKNVFNRVQKQVLVLYEMEKDFKRLSANMI